MADINLGVGGANSAVAGGYDIDNSLKLERDNSENLYRQIINGNRKTWTTSLWIKRTNVSASNYQMVITHGIYGYGTFLRIMTDDTLQTGIEYSSGQVRQTTNQVLRDTSAWMHLVWRVDTTQADGDNRSRLYINGEQVTSFSQNETIAQNTDTFCNYDHSGYDDEQFGYKEASLFTSMYYADVYHIDGQSLAPTEFGEVDSDSGIWKPIEANISSFGNNGYYLNFSNSSNLGEDTAGNGSFTLNNITAADQATDTPTNNFATFNPLHTNYGNYIEGASTIQSTGTGWSSTISTIAPASGKWYVEFKVQDSGPASMIGVSPVQSSNNLVTGHYSGTSGDNGVSWYDFNGVIRNNAVGVATYSTWGNTDIVALALDLDNHKIYFAKNNTWQNSANPATGTNGISLLDTSSQFYIGASFYYNGPDYIYGNYGGFSGFTISSAASDENGYGTFEYAPPSGYYALCTKNLAEFG